MPATPDAVSTGERVLVLIRAINVGGASMLPMADLRAAAAGLGHTDVATHLATGNLLLVPAAGSATTAPALAAQLTTDLADTLGRPLALTVRTRAQVDAIVAGNPYLEAAEDDPAHLVVMFFDGPVTADQPDLARYGRERATWAGDNGYLHYPDGIGRSKVTADVITRLAGRQGTGRNWRTVQALHHKLTPDPHPTHPAWRGRWFHARSPGQHALTCGNTDLVKAGAQPWASRQASHCSTSERS